MFVPAVSRTHGDNMAPRRRLWRSYMVTAFLCTLTTVASSHTSDIYETYSIEYHWGAVSGVVWGGGKSEFTAKIALFQWSAVHTNKI